MSLLALGRLLLVRLRLGGARLLGRPLLLTPGDGDGADLLASAIVNTLRHVISSIYLARDPQGGVRNKNNYLTTFLIKNR